MLHLAITKSTTTTPYYSNIVVQLPHEIVLETTIQKVIPNEKKKLKNYTHQTKLHPDQLLKDHEVRTHLV